VKGKIYQTIEDEEEERRELNLRYTWPEGGVRERTKSEGGAFMQLGKTHMDRGGGTVALWERRVASQGSKLPGDQRGAACSYYPILSGPGSQGNRTQGSSKKKTKKEKKKGIVEIYLPGFCILLRGIRVPTLVVLGGREVSDE